MDYIPVKSDIGEKVDVTITETGRSFKKITGTLLDIKNNKYYVETKNGKRWYKYVTIEKDTK